MAEHRPRMNQPPNGQTRPAPRPVEITAGDVFLSPRVIDRGTFEAYSARLREMIEECRRHSGELTTLITEARRAHESSRAAIKASAEQAEPWARMLKAAEERRAELETMLARAAEVERGAAETQARLSDSFDAHTSRLQASLAEFERRSEDAANRAEARIRLSADDAVRQVDAAIDRLNTARQNLAQQAETTVLASEKLLRVQCERAEKLLGRGPALTANPGSGMIAPKGLEALTLAAEQAAGKAEAARASLQALQSKAEDAILKLSQSLEGSVLFSDRLIDQHGSLAAQTRASLAQIEKARASLAEIAANQQRAAEAGAGLEDVLRRSDRSIADSQHASAELRRVVDLAADALEFLEPWKSLLLNPRAAGAIPAPIAEMIGKMRSELSSDLAGVARAIQAIADRGARTAGSPVSTGSTPTATPAPKPAAQAPSKAPPAALEKSKPARKVAGAPTSRPPEAA